MQTSYMKKTRSVKNVRNILHKNQYGFILGRLTQTAEFDLIKDLHCSINLRTDSSCGWSFFLFSLITCRVFKGRQLCFQVLRSSKTLLPQYTVCILLSIGIINIIIVCCVQKPITKNMFL